MPNMKGLTESESGGRLLADIGGTHARFAWQQESGAPLKYVQVLQCCNHAGLSEAAHYWLQTNHLPAPRQASIAVACPVNSDLIKLTNNDWSFSVQSIQSQLDLERLLVVNDFTALALALPMLEHQHLFPLGLVEQLPFQRREPVALLGAGTGLGVSGLLPNPKGGWTALSGEGGHISLAVHNALQRDVWTILQARLGHVSAEDVLSGQGLVNLYSCLLTLESGCWPDLQINPSAITNLASQKDPLALKTLGLFVDWLGSTAGDLALTLGAVGGVYIGGGISPRLRSFLETSTFRSSFESKGRFSSYLSSIPIWLIDAPVSPALEGASTLLD
jgi:glucokinase